MIYLWKETALLRWGYTEIKEKYKIPQNNDQQQVLLYSWGQMGSGKVSFQVTSKSCLEVMHLDLDFCNKVKIAYDVCSHDGCHIINHLKTYRLKATTIISLSLMVAVGQKFRKGLAGRLWLRYRTQLQTNCGWCRAVRTGRPSPTLRVASGFLPTWQP